jgi:hypothetical protein
MAVLSTADRTKVWRGVMRHWSNTGEVVEAIKTEIYNVSNDTGAIADLDSWLDTHGSTTAPDTVGANGALNSSYRNKFTASQKATLVAVLAAMRVSTSFAARLLDLS